MPVLIDSPFKGEIVWLGHVPAGESLQAKSVDQLDVGFEGVAHGRHQGANRPSCSRVKNVYPRDTEIRNSRQLSIVSQEELAVIAADMGLDHLDPRLLGISILVKGIPDFTHIPPSTRLQGPTGATLVVDMENRPCILPGREIEVDHSGLGASFKPAAKNRRGVTAWVERPGMLAIGDELHLFTPDQRGWQP